MNPKQVNWAALSFAELEKVFNREQSALELNEAEREMLSRYGDIQCFLTEDHIWPPSPALHARFDPAFRELLTRLPPDVFDIVQSRISFVVEDPTVNITAVNVPAPAGIPPEQGIDTIVVFHTAWELSQSARVGLLVHEIAHSFVRGSDYKADEQLADEKVRAWGFGEELAQLKLALRGEHPHQ